VDQPGFDEPRRDDYLAGKLFIAAAARDCPTAFPEPMKIAS